jgi:methylated-DNA-[protein]-cysteine S-methyltransferase
MTDKREAVKYKSPLGIITIEAKNGAVSRIYLPNANPCPAAAENTDNAVLAEAVRQFTEYFAGTRRAFDLPLDFGGCTDFMKSVYLELLKIPYGQTASYKNIAERVNCPKGYRAVGLANNKNPLAVIIPCHRVIGSDGKLVGFGGGIGMKIKLLELEKNKQV